MGYSNFKDPIGLLKRMLASGNKTAYSVLVREALGKLLIPVDYLLQPGEQKKLGKPAKNPDYPIILVLGGSRSGTTLLYQTLARHLKVGYINNFVSAFPRSPISANALFKGIIPKTSGKYQNYFGSVAGPGGPNDAFFLWNRWLGEDRNRIPEQIDPESKLDMKRFFDTWLSVTDQAFLNKNNRNSLCAPLFDEVLGNVYFVEIHRNPVFVAQSLVLSRRKVQGSDKIGWGLLSNDTTPNTGEPLQYIDDVCDQVYRVDQAIALGRNKIDADKYLRVSYEDFCENPAEIILKTSRRTKVDLTDPENLARLQFSTASNGQRLKDDEFNRIQSRIQTLYGNRGQ